MSREHHSGLGEVTGEEVVRRARAGDLPSQEFLADHFQKLLLSVVRVRMGKHLRRYAAPEDVAQEAMLSSLKAIDSLRESACLDDFKAILLRNAEWRLIHLSRKVEGFFPQSNANAGESLAERVITLLSTGPVTAADDRSWLDRHIARLSPIYAQVLQLHMSGKSFSGIATDLALSEDAVRKRYTRAAHQLRLILESLD